MRGKKKTRNNNKTISQNGIKVKSFNIHRDRLVAQNVIDATEASIFFPHIPHNKHHTSIIRSIYYLHLCTST
jgi:hypothetical protein